MYFGAKVELFQRAADMRKNPTKAEKMLWKFLRKFRSTGFIFRQQHPIDIFIADFYCHTLKLIIEVDGEIHSSDEAQRYDDGRTGELEKLGLCVIRFTNDEVINNQEHVQKEIFKYIPGKSLPSEKSPLPKSLPREGGT